MFVFAFRIRQERAQSSRNRLSCLISAAVGLRTREGVLLQEFRSRGLEVQLGPLGACSIEPARECPSSTLPTPSAINIPTKHKLAPATKQQRRSSRSLDEDRHRNGGQTAIRASTLSVSTA